ncbi:MAG: hypothetical protein AABZ30_01130, partial [Myxococcota bacterium]
ATCLSACTVAGNWTLTSVDDVANQVGRYASIDLDPASGVLHVSYYDSTALDLKYARCDFPATACDAQAEWTKMTIDTSGDSGRWSSIALGAGRPHVAYSSGATLKHAWCDAGDATCATSLAAWSFETVTNNDVSANYGEYASLGVAPAGASGATDRVHVSYYDAGTGGGRLEYGVREGGAWTVSVLDDTANAVGLWTALAVDTAATAPARRYVHVAYYEGGAATQLKYLRFDPNSIDSDCNGW